MPSDEVRDWGDVGYAVPTFDDAGLILILSGDEKAANATLNCLSTDASDAVTPLSRSVGLFANPRKSGVQGPGAAASTGADVSSAAAGVGVSSAIAGPSPGHGPKMGGDLADGGRRAEV